MIETLKFENQWPFVSSPNFWPGRKIPCTTIIYHYTASGRIEDCVKYFQKKDGTSAHFVIERDGRVVQMVRVEDRSWHAGESVWKNMKGVNNFSVGIEICNWGPLKKVGNQIFCWPNNYSQKFIGNKLFTDGAGKIWEGYSNEQIDSVIKVTNFILLKYPDIKLEDITGHEFIAPGRKQDPGPAFPWEQVKAALKK